MFPRTQRGFAIVSAIFLLVVLAALGGFIATVSTNQQIGAALDVMGARAYQAARSGTEWGLYQALKASSCAASTDIGVLDGIAVTVNCSVVASSSTATTESGIGVIYSISATACNIPANTAPACPGSSSSPNYVERRVVVLADTTPQ